MLLFRPKFNLIRPLHISFVALSTFCFLIPFPRNYSQSIPKRLSDLFPTPLCTRSMALRLSSQQQNSLLITKKERSCEIIENLDPMCRQYTLDTTLWSAVFKCNKRQSDLHANRVKESNFKKERLTTYDIYSPLIVRFVCVQSILPSYVA